MKYLTGLRGPAILLLFGLTGALAGCSGSSGSSSSNGTVDRDPPTSPPGGDGPGQGGPTPSVSLSAADTAVDQGQSTQLTWSSSDTTSCQASGGWSGNRQTQGNETVGPITQSTTFTLSCSGPGGSAMSMLSVAVNGTVTLSWQAPEERVDGTPLDNLAGYRIYYGTQSRSYDNTVAVNNPSTTQRSIVLQSGSYFFAMTAIDTDGLESGYSNEVIRSVN